MVAEPATIKPALVIASNNDWRAVSFSCERLCDPFAAALVGNDIAVYVPTVLRKIKNGNAPSITAWRPLFLGYLFAASQQRIVTDIARDIGMWYTDLLEYPPTKLKPQLAALEAAIEIHPGLTTEKLLPGVMAIVTQGPWQGVTVHVQKVGDRVAVGIPINSLGAFSEIGGIPLEWLEVLEEDAPPPELRRARSHAGESMRKYSRV